MIEKVVFMNMCMISDNKGNVLALDKVGKNYSGTTFPGGHVEAGETFMESVIREVFEETGLTIKNPKLMGIYHWISGDVRNVGFLYRTDEFEGKLISSDEGRVYWISEKDYPKKIFSSGYATGMADNAFRCAYGMSANYNRRRNYSKDTVRF